MEQYFEIPASTLEASNSAWTAREILQQPKVWRQAAANIDKQRAALDAWLQPLLAKPECRMVLTGAGTSAFIGETLAPHLRKTLRRRVDAISTTDIVSDPGQYFSEDVPTLLISFARSGDSPESVASVELANQVLSDCYHLVLTCNHEGYLAKLASSNTDNTYCVLMPEGTNDRSFAMTSSYSSMLVTCLSIFSSNPRQLEQTANLTERLLSEQLTNVRSLAKRGFTRLVVLGAGCLLGTAREASLKCLELSAGEVVPMFDSPLGFRHGPKSVLDKNTLLLLLRSADAYSARFDNDLLTELQDDKQLAHIVALSPAALGEAALDEEVSGEKTFEFQDVWLSLVYIVYCQMLGFFAAIERGIGADNPCPSGEVNRVVKGVIIHPYRGQ